MVEESIIPVPHSHNQSHPITIVYGQVRLLTGYLAEFTGQSQQFVLKFRSTGL